MKKITFKLEFKYDDRDTEIELIEAVNDLIFDLGSWSMLESIWEEHKIETVDDYVYIDEGDEPEMIAHQEARRRTENATEPAKPHYIDLHKNYRKEDTNE